MRIHKYVYCHSSEVTVRIPSEIREATEALIPNHSKSATSLFPIYRAGEEAPNLYLFNCLLHSQTHFEEMSHGTRMEFEPGIFRTQSGKHTPRPPSRQPRTFEMQMGLRNPASLWSFFLACDAARLRHFAPLLYFCVIML